MPIGFTTEISNLKLFEISDLTVIWLRSLIRKCESALLRDLKFEISDLTVARLRSLNRKCQSVLLRRSQIWNLRSHSHQAQELN